VDGQNTEQKCADGAKLAEIRMVSQQSETKTVVVEVHRSQEVDDSVAIPKSTLVSERLTAEEVRDKVNHSCHV
jgi:division protein CdvB (Snf7/Vps24/ESCRT-III family)